MFAQNVKNKPIIIGLTGGISTGKSTALKYFMRKGIFVIDSDQIVKSLWQTDQGMIHEVEKRLGVLVNDDESRKELTKLVFNDSEKLKILNQIVHPRVFFQIEQLKKANAFESIIVIDMPLLIEVGYQKKCDYTLLVDISEAEQKRRLMLRSKLNEEEANKRIMSQLKMEQKRKHVDVILDNNGTVEDLYSQIDDFLRSIAN